MINGVERLVRVHQDWCGWHSAEIPVDALTGVHWRQPNGAPHRLLYGFVACSAIVSGDIPHDCRDGSTHRLAVCVLKRHTTPVLFDELSRRADAGERRRPPVPLRALRPSAQ